MEAIVGIEVAVFVEIAVVGGLPVHAPKNKSPIRQINAGRFLIA